MADLTGKEFDAVAEDVHDALRRSLRPEAFAALECGAFASELQQVRDAGAALAYCLGRRDGSRSWAAALTVRAGEYHDAMLACESAVSAVATVDRAASRM